MPSPPASDDLVNVSGPTLPRAGSGVRAVTGDTLFKAGDRVAENIQLVSILGVGGMGDVWLANHIGLETAVAVKFMSASLAHDEALIERFAREAKLASRIKSPHVVQIFDFATTHEGIPYIVMELIEGETLEARIRRDKAIGLDETSRIVVQLCRALTKAHEIGIVHRDMKPDNVLLGVEEGDLFVKILDFGIAKHVGGPKGTTDAGTTIGTPSYMSPEQLFHPDAVDHGSDLWALGVMTYQCVTGTLPFQGESFAAVCVAINEGTYPIASKVNPDIPRTMDAWFGKALATSRSERFCSAKEMSDAYLKVLDDAEQLPVWAVRKETPDGEARIYASVSGPLPASLVPPRRHVRGSRWRAAALVMAAAMLVAVGFLSRDAALGLFVRTHVPAAWASWANHWLGEPASPTASSPPRAAFPEAVTTAVDAPVAFAPVVPLMARMSLPKPTPNAAPIAPPMPANVAPSAMPSAAPIEPLRGTAVEEPSSELDNNPYSDTGAPEPPASPSAETTPEPNAPRNPRSFEPHAPGL